MGLRDASRKDYGTRGTIIATDEIRVGTQQRIADALEKMVKPYTQLIDDRNQLVRERDELYDRVSCLRYRIRALRGVITKLKNKK